MKSYLAQTSIFGVMAGDNSTFIVSARKYRPESWKEVIGQGSITETLHNSITQDHMAHAYLFCGPRGVGKTTCARIFAKEINRTDEHNEDEDFSFNIFELDAASNNGVDEMRSLTDQVRIPPQVGKYKVYIIDEVHMLSKAAFNAFLKTLEEPPAHAIFILATTEKHKIIPTILSRCQIYDFNRIGINDIMQQLRHIASNEKIKFEEEALHIIAQKADGAMRDALSIFDQLSSFTNQHLTYDAVLKNLHVLDYDYYFVITENLIGQEFADALVSFDSILKQGFDGHHFLSGLGNHFRDLLVCKEPRTLQLLEVGDSVKQKYKEQAQAADTEWLIDALKIVNETDFRLRNAPNTRLLIETTLLSLASLGLEKKNDEREVTPLSAPKVKKEPVVLPSAPNLSIAVHKDQREEKVEGAELQNAVDAQPDGNPQEEEHDDDPAPIPDATTIGKAALSETPLEITSAETPTAITTDTDHKRTKRKPSTVSLKLSDSEGVDANKAASGEDELAEVEQTTNDGEIGTSVQSSVDIQAAWAKICQEFFENGKSALYSILVKQELESQLRDKEITVVLSHQVDEEEFNQHRTEVLSRLKSLTGQRDLTLIWQRNENKEEAKRFTPQDKFEYLAQQNPLLRKLKSDLDLDITY